MQTNVLPPEKRPNYLLGIPWKWAPKSRVFLILAPQDVNLWDTKTLPARKKTLRFIVLTLKNLV